MEDRHCGTDPDNAAPPTCHTKNHTDASNPSLNHCIRWAEKQCNASTATLWYGNWCGGYVGGCPDGEIDSTLGKDQRFKGFELCKKTGNITCYRNVM